MEMSHEKVQMSHYNKKCPIDIENYGAIGPSTLSSFLITDACSSGCTTNIRGPILIIFCSIWIVL